MNYTSQFETPPDPANIRVLITSSKLLGMAMIKVARWLSEHHDVEVASVKSEKDDDVWSILLTYTNKQ